MIFIYYLDLSSTESYDHSIELTKDQVKAALTSLMLNSKQSRKRGRNKSSDRSIEKINKKKSKTISNDIILSNLSPTHSIILGTSNLNHHQMVCFISKD